MINGNSYCSHRVAPLVHTLNVSGIKVSETTNAASVISTGTRSRTYASTSSGSTLTQRLSVINVAPHSRAKPCST